MTSFDLLLACAIVAPIGLLLHFDSPGYLAARNLDHAARALQSDDLDSRASSKPRGAEVRYHLGTKGEEMPILCVRTRGGGVQTYANRLRFSAERRETREEMLRLCDEFFASPESQRYWGTFSRTRSGDG